ncbi:DUF2267 domain-containing protein [Amycolatopsis cihanbeyliensis]|uniref:DUF2267 domain-containing protein n=1 Tax=Amycolatopsis cihanbeyliensis TaxID=1128664 RepID=A0A542DJ08_AMYCI|nr:DUF2267 domain-containing protein [Amycolatopsis cihanbeyliensis]TQJ03087.1 hypothetical protein FB471_2837 [Amycolatopsis cihanbeyliensis]
MATTGTSCVIGLLADPGLPTELAHRLSEELPAALAERIGDRVCWEVRVVSEPLILDENNRIPIVEHAREKRSTEGWDLMICLTDLPRRLRERPVIADLSTRHRVALAALPAIGWLRLRAHTLRTLAVLVEELSEYGRPAGAAQRGLRRPLERMSAVRRVESPDEQLDAALTLVGLRGRLRLLFGLVRDNRPWRLVPSLSGAIAAAGATAAFGVFFPTIWSMADALSAGRLAVISVFAVTAMVVWMIVHNGLWERPRHLDSRREAVLYNLASILTLVIGVSCMYVVLFALTLLAAVTVISSDYLATRLGHPAGLTDYLGLVWLASSMGTVAGALGSSFESEDAVLQATYSRRERQRRERAKEAREAEESGESGEGS